MEVHNRTDGTNAMVHKHIVMWQRSASTQQIHCCTYPNIFAHHLQRLAIEQRAQIQIEEATQ